MNMKSKNRLSNFTIVDNKYIVNSELSLQAIGLYTFMCSKPDDWTFSYAGLGSQLGESVKTLKKIVKELVLSHAIVRVATTVTTKEGHKFPSFDWIINPNADDVALAKIEDPVLKLLKDGHSQNGGDQNGGDQNGGDQNGGDHFGAHIVITNPSNKEDSKKEISKEVIDYLNAKIGSKYKYNNKFVLQQIENNYSAKELISVIDKKYDDWWGGGNEQYIRPSTLFGDKFEEYLNTKSREQRIREEKFAETLYQKVKEIINVIESKKLQLKHFVNFTKNKDCAFTQEELNVLNSYNSMEQLLSLFRQGELKLSLKEKSTHV